MKLRRVVVVYKKSSYQVYARERRDRRFLKLLRQKHGVVGRLVRSHRAHTEVLGHVRSVLRRRGIAVEFIYRAQGFSERKADLVLTVGGDGTFLEASHSVIHRPILGINSNPEESVGFLCGTTARRLERILDSIREDRLHPTELARLRVRMDKKVLPVQVLNDVLICHANPAATSRYIMQLRGIREEHKSSGVWISPPAGSTAATGAAGGRRLPIRSRAFQFLVREIYHPTGKRFRLAGGIVRPGDSLVVFSKMRAGKIYLDGAHIHYPFSIGERLQISATAPPLLAFGLDGKRGRRRS
ncbi:MAG TPA: NAD(+)/NADH kinase [Bdellovibrionota bacterium]|nr:NAD(+)/NADH kinase [Bdellovibrionota bacterium]